jgi:hypothetical protein
MNLRHQLALLGVHLRALRGAADERGASTVETVIIVAALAALAIATLAAITALVDTKVGGIHL